VKEHKKLVYEQFPQRISRADFKKLELVYQKIVDDDETMQEIEEIVQFATPKFNGALQNGREIYDYIESNLEINPVGITPLYRDAGYLFLEEYTSQETKVYEYQITFFENTYETYRGINTQYLETIRRGLSNTLESIKVSLTQKKSTLPNPATFAIIAKVPCSFDQSFLPIAKRSLVKYVSSL
jgi:hypothetical protein